MAVIAGIFGDVPYSVATLAAVVVPRTLALVSAYDCWCCCCDGIVVAAAVYLKVYQNICLYCDDPYAPGYGVAGDDCDAAATSDLVSADGIFDESSVALVVAAAD